ncbi:MAG: AsmA-like C-terminal region-containing protein [Chitinispirillia bacterium]|nr:AsmA-like C-terminal region-containing protein [Chitinispirillia bacterium]
MNKPYKSEKILTLVFFILAFLVLLGFLPFRLKALNKIAEDALLNAGADSVRVEMVSVTFFTGVSVKGLETSKRISPRVEYRTSIERVDISSNLLLLAFWVLGKSDLLNLERDIFMEIYENPFTLVSDASTMIIDAKPFKKVSVRGAGVEFFERKKPSLSAFGANVKIDKKHNAIWGKIDVSQVTIPSLVTAKNFSAKLHADTERLFLMDGSGTVFGGKMRADASIDLENASLLEGKIAIAELDLEKFCTQMKFTQGSMSGKVSVSAAFQKSNISTFDSVLDSIKASGNITVKNLTAVNLPLQNTQIMSFVSPELKTLRFSEVNGNFALDRSRLRFSEIVGRGDIMNFKSSGWVGLDASLHQDFEGVFSKDFSSTLSGLVRSSLEADTSGGRRFNCRISGTFQNPRVDIDGSVYGRAAGSVINNAAQGLRNLFR